MNKEIYSPPESELDQTSSSTAVDNPHSLAKQVTGFVVASILFLALLFLNGIPLVLIGMFVFLDAWNSGIYKNYNVRKFTNLSPMGWGIGVMALFIVVYPIYVFCRNKLKTKEGPLVYWVILNILGVVLILLTIFQVWVIIYGIRA